MDKKTKKSGGIGYIITSCILFVGIYLVYASGNLSIKGIETHVATEPFAFYFIIAVFSGMNSLILIFGVTELFKR
jgi:hypothetical protein